MNEPFKSLIRSAKQDSNVLGFFLVGSRGKGFETKLSDYDVILVVKNKTVFKIKKLKDIDLKIMSLSNFKKYATWGSPEAWNRYDFAHVKALIDKNGCIQKLIDEKGRIPNCVRRSFVSGVLDAYINAVFRSTKCLHNHNVIGARLEAAASIPYFLDVIFGINGRLRPFFDYLKRELHDYPLKKFPWSKNKFIKDILSILKNADLKTQQKLLKDIEVLSRKEGYGKVFDTWEGKDKWAMQFHHV